MALSLKESFIRWRRTSAPLPPSFATPNGAGAELFYILLASALALFGAAVLAVSFYVPWQVWRMRDWPTTPVRITNLKFDELGCCSYNLLYTINYVWNGRAYQKHEHSSGSSAPAVRAARMQSRRLEKAQHEELDLPAVLNPKFPKELYLLPEESTEPRHLQTDKLALILVRGGGFGLVCIVLGIAIARRLLRRRGLREELRSHVQEHPDRPWEPEPRWKSLSVPDEFNQALGYRWAIALCWAMVAVLAVQSARGSPFILVNGRGVHMVDPVHILAVVLLGVGTFQLSLAVHASLRRLKYGASRLQLPHIPLELEHQYDLVVRIPRSLKPVTTFDVTLRCVKRATTSVNGKQQVETTRTYEHTWSVPGSALALDGRELLLRVEIPRKQRGRQVIDLPTFQWQVVVYAVQPGVDFKAAFELPVYASASPAVADLLSAIVTRAL